MDLMTRRRALMAQEIQMPSIYAFYDYIEFIPESYLDTQYIPTIAPKIDTRLRIMSNLDSDIFGFAQNVFPSFIVDASIMGSVWYNRWGSINSTQFSQKITTIADCTFGQYTVIDGAPQSAFPDVSWNTNVQSMKVGGGRENRCDVQVYSFRFYDGDTLVRDLLPCLRRTDNAIGMYDTVTESFYQSAGTAIPILGNIN